MADFSTDRPLILHETSSAYIKLKLSWANLPTDGNKQVLYERYLGHWLEKKEREAMNAEAERRMLEERKRQDEKARTERLSDEEKDRLFPTWKQCSDCEKWRALPHDLILDTLPENWVCSMNVFDAEHNSCDKSEVQRPTGVDDFGVTQESNSSQQEDRNEKGNNVAEDKPAGIGSDEDSTWVQCDDCNKWRALPKDTVVEDLPDIWTCDMNTDRARDSCDKSEADHDDFDDEDSKDEEDEYGFTKEYKERILKNYKEYVNELQEKKRTRAEREESMAKERTERMLVKQKADFENWARKLSPSDKTAGKRTANRVGVNGRLPISMYPYEFDEAKACKLLLRDLHFGVNVNAEDHNGVTAIYHAHMNYYEGYVQLLLAAGAVDDELHLESDDYFMGLENPRRGKKVKDEWGLDRFL